MTNAAPWSVKGIDPRAREAAREAARRQGLTIGEWLNQAILANEAALAHARGEDTPPSYREPRNSADHDQRLADALHQLAERVDVNDRRNALALTGIDRTLSAVAARVESAEHETLEDGGRVSDLLDELRDAQAVLLEQMRRIETEDLPALQAGIEVPNDRLGALEEDMHTLSAKALAAEAATGEALMRLDGVMSALDVKLTNAVSPAQIDAQVAGVREQFESSLDNMAQDVAAMIAETRADIAGQIVAALGGLQPEEMNQALADVSRRLTAAERRHTQTIEAVSIEIKRLSENMDRRVRVIEARNDDGGAAELREEISNMSKAVEHRLTEMESREVAAFSRMGDEVGRIADKLDARVSNSEARSADAIEKVGEQVALMAERLSAKQDKFATDVAERIVQSEERQSGRLSDALNAISTRLEAIDSSADANPVAKAMNSFEARLKAIETSVGVPVTLPDVEPLSAPAYLETPVVRAEAPAVRLEHEDDLHARYGAPQPDLAPYATPLAEPETYRRAGPLADPEPSIDLAEDVEEPPRETIYLEDIEEEFSRREEDPAFAPQYELPQQQTKNLDDPFADIEAAPPEDEEEDLFWSTGKPEGAPAPHETSRDRHAAPAPAATAFFDADDDAGEEPRLIDDGATFSAGAREDQELESAMFGASLDLESATPAVKEDYLAAARRAAQANVQAAKTKTKKSKDPEKARGGEAPAGGLRGMTRVVLWGAAGALAAAIAGGVYAYGNHGKDLDGNDIDPRANKAALNAAPPGSIAEGAALAAAEAEQPTVTPPTDAVPLDDAPPAHAGPMTGAVLTPSSVTADSARTISAAFSTLADAAARGEPVAQYEYGLARLASGDAQNAVVYLRRAANQDVAMAQYRLAKLYERGEGVPVDLSEARRWTERAAQAGNRKAMHDLGVYYARGEGAPFDEAAAFKWFLQAANYGVADSQFNLGVLYGQGRGVVADNNESLFWFQIAAAGGDNDARARAAMIEEKIGPNATAAVKARVRAFRAKPLVARANGDFGRRPWAQPSAIEAAVDGPPRS